MFYRYSLLILFFLFVHLRVETSDIECFVEKCIVDYENVELLPYYRHGWHLHEQSVQTIFDQKDIKVVFEVGSWVGNWTIFIAEKLPENGRIFAIDHWGGSVEHHNPGTLEYSLLSKLYQQFLSNIIHCGLKDKVVPVRMESGLAAAEFQELSLRADLIYIDASHDYDSVLRDLSLWFPLLAPGGILCGDDWNLGDVPRAVQDFARLHDLRVRHHREFWWYDE